jgi:septum formation protein
MRKDFVYLASGSPRRSELLRQIGVPFRVRPAAIPEEQAAGEAPDAYVLRLAGAKAGAVWSGLDRSGDEPRPVLAADTAVVLDGRVLGKPADATQAEAMLGQLSGRTHRVLTAIALRTSAGTDTLLNASEVRFRATTAEERRAYCATGEPFDKAGGYGIQGRAAVFVEHLCGSYSGVVGLPLYETAVLLARHGVGFWLKAVAAA